MKRILIAFVALTALGGCGIFGGGDKKPKTPVLGERLPVLTYETGAEVDPSLADAQVDVPPAEANAAWPQTGGNAAHAIGHPALGQALGRAWTAKVAGSSKKARLAAGPVVGDGRVYVTDTEATVRAFNVSDGRLVWQTRLTDKGGSRNSFERELKNETYRTDQRSSRQSARKDRRRKRVGGDYRRRAGFRVESKQQFDLRGFIFFSGICAALCRRLRARVSESPGGWKSGRLRMPRRA